MEQTVLIWCVIMGVLLLTFAMHAAARLRRSAHSPHTVAGHHRNHHHHHFIELGRERDMFYIPGDRKDDDYDESEDY